jgi:WD40 repeat protein
MKTSSRFFRAFKFAMLFVVPLALSGTIQARPPRKPVAGRFAAIAFSPDGKTLAAANTCGVIQLWDTTKGAQVGNLTDLQTLIRLAFSPDGKTLVATSWEGGATLWDVPTASIRAVLKGHTDVIEGVAFSSDGKTLATASWDETVKLWDVESARCKQSIKGPGTQRAVAVSPDGTARPRDQEGAGVREGAQSPSVLCEVFRRRQTIRDRWRQPGSPGLGRPVR